jgi:acyl carrier protein
MTETLSTVRTFVGQHVGGAQLGDDEDIFSSGRVNSLFAVQLVMWVERTFGITVQADDLDIANFRTVASVAGFVATRLEQPAPEALPAG